MVETYDFCSDEWVRVARRLVEAALDGVDLDGVYFSFCEVFTDVPAHLLTPGQTSLAWHVRIRENVVHVGSGRIEADYQVEGEYEVARQIARLPYSDPSMASLMQKAISEGLVRNVGDPTAVPVQIMAALTSLHDDVAEYTA